jgi:ribosomal protein RSM22 (predicted rRNA methylase)
LSPELPAPLRAAIARELEGVSRKDLAERAGRTSEAYRAGRGSAGVIQVAEDALAYALARLPATYAACAAVLAQAQAMAPEFAPRRLLDAGAGPGAASWAAAEAYDIAEVAWLDASAPFLALAARLASEGPTPLSAARALRTDLTAAAEWPSAELVMASYALAEIGPALQAGVVTRLWAACEGLLALIEPGTPAGHQRLLAARAVLIGLGAEVLAPCPHARACPLTAPDWCHFAVRLPRSRDHRLAKGAEAPFEDEKFAYLIAARPGIAGPERRGRILAPPRVGKPGTTFKVCGAGGLETRIVAKRDKAAHAATRRLGWGDLI